MAEQSGISWTNATFNPWIGCTKVSPACKFCYAERDMDQRFNKVSWGPNGTRKLTSDKYWREPFKWNKQAEESGVRKRVFCASLADVFEDWEGPILDHRGYQLHNSICGWLPDGPNPKIGVTDGAVTMDNVRQRLFHLIDATPNLDWLLLTKRPENIRRMWPTRRLHWDPSPLAFGSPYPKADATDIYVRAYYRKNVWIGTSVENQEYADKRIPKLMNCRDLTPVLFLSCEPLLGPVDLTRVEGEIGIGLHSYDVLNGMNIHWDDDGQWTPYDKIDWVIAGGESGPEARHSHPAWFRSLRDQCEAAGVPFHFKQWGEFEYQPAPEGRRYTGTWILDEHEPVTPVRVGVKAAGRLLDGVEHNGLPRS